MLLQSVIDNVLVGIVVLKSVRDENGESTDFEYQIVSAEAAEMMQHFDLVGMERNNLPRLLFPHA